MDKKYPIKGVDLMKKLLSIVLCLSMMVITSCDIFQVEEPEYEVRLDQNKITMFVGEEVEVSGSAYCDGEQIESPQLTWESSDPSVAAVHDGHIEAVGLGRVKITAKYENAQKDITVDCVGEITSEKANSFDEKYINIFGRYYAVDGGLKLDQTANALEIGIIGTSLSVELTSDLASYMKIYIDGEGAGRIEVSSGRSTYKVTDNLEEGYHVIRIVKDTEMQNAKWTLHSFDSPRFASVPEKSELKIEFIGDSLTAGYGSIGKRGEAWSVNNSSPTEAYAYKTAELLGADFSIIAWSGICTRAYLWTDINMASLYNWKSSENTERYEFDDEPDVIVINLGTNDASYIMNGHSDYKEKFFDHYLEFLMDVRKSNPNAYIICIYGVAGEHPTVTEGIQMASALIDDKVVFNPFEFVPNGAGVNGHPTKEAYDGWAKSLAEYIEGLNIE